MATLGGADEVRHAGGIGGGEEITAPVHAKDIAALAGQHFDQVNAPVHQADHRVARPRRIRPRIGRQVVAGTRARRALEEGGTSFDALYVNVNGASGYFDRSLHAYGQEGRPCDRCGAEIVRVSFMNRSSYFCPVCQPAPRARRTR